MLNINSLIAHLRFVRRKPLVLGRVAKGIFKKSFLRRDVLRTVDLAVTGDCHYRCNFCSAHLLYKDKKPYLSIPKIKEILKESRKLGAIHLNLTGGEPLLRDFDDICEIIRSFSPRRSLISMVTNALLLTFERLNLLKKGGLDTLQLSLESLDAREHDDMVGVKGSFDKVMQALDYAASLDLNICMNVVVDRASIKRVKDIANLAKEKGAFVVLDTVSSVGRLKGREELRLDEEYEEEFEGLLKDSYIRHDSSINFSLKRECPGGKERIHISAYGDVFTCPLVQVSYGNVNSEPLKLIYKRLSQYPHIKREFRLCKHAFDKDYYRTIAAPAERTLKPPIYIDDILKVKE